MNEIENCRRLRGEISILKEEFQRIKTVAEQEKKRADWNYESFINLQKKLVEAIEELEKTKEQRDELDKELSLHIPAGSNQREQSASALPPAGIDAILAEREKTHGSFHTHANCTQTLEDTFYSFKDRSFFTAVQLEALHMIFHKLGRIAAGSPDFQDHWDDIAGYSTLVSKDISSAKGK